MKRTLNIILTLLLLFSFSTCVFSQSDQKELDQAKLAKQFIGTWKCEIGKDSILHGKIEPLGKGMHITWEWKASDNVFNRAKSILGFSDRGELIMYHLWQDGTMSMDIGKFVSEEKLMMERYAQGNHHANSLWEIVFTESEHTWFLKNRGMEITWEPLSTNEWKMKKVKE